MFSAQQRTTFLITILLITIILVPYLQVRGYDFVLYDDPRYVTANEHVRLGLTGENVRWALTATETGFWHPLTWLSLMADYELYGLNPAGYHITNVLLHIISTLLLFFVLGRMTGALWRSALVAALFAVHPLHVESVAWIAERKDVLSALFWMLTMGAYTFYAARPSGRRYLGVLSCFLLGMMAKPMLVPLPFVLLLLDYWPLGRLKGERDIRPLVTEKIPLLAISLLVGLVTIYAEKKFGALPLSETYPWEVRLANGVVSYATYLGKTLWPTNLSVFYPYVTSLPLIKTILSICLLLAVSVLAIGKAKSRPYLLTGWFWYLIALLPVIGLIQVGHHALADRYTYLPSIGIFMAAVWGGDDLLKKRQKLLVPLSIGIILLCVLVTGRQVKNWQNSQTLFAHALAATEKNYVAHNNLGLALLEKGRLEEAAFHFSEAIRIKPEGVKLLLNMGITLSKQRKYADALPYFQKAIRIKPDHVDSYLRLADAYLSLGKDKEAGENYARVLRLDPRNALGETNWAMILIRQGQNEAALALLRKAIVHQPDLADAHNDLGFLYAQMGRTEEAVAAFVEARRLAPQRVDIRNNLAILRQRQGKRQATASGPAKSATP